MGLTFEAKDKNGCGPWWVPREWKDRYFQDECNLHDSRYFNKEDKDKADKEFYVKMLEKIKLEKNSKERRLRGFQARVFYYAVRNLGWIVYRGK